MLAIPAAIAFADTLKDNLDSNNASVSLGTIQPGGTGSGSVPLTVECTGNSHGSGSVPFSVAKALATGSAGSTSEVSVSPSVVLPNTWPADGAGCGNPKPSQSGMAQISVSVPANAAAGDRSIKVTIQSTDADVTNTVNFHVNYSVPGNNTPADTTAPNPPSVDLDAASDSGSSNSDDITNDNTPTFNGTAEANSTVEVFVGTTSLGTAQADASGNWSLTVDNLQALSDGVHSITAKATDAAGNTSAASSALSVRIDTVAPQVLPGDVNNTTWRNSPLSQAFTASDPAPASGLANAGDAGFTLTASAESTKDAAGAVVPTSVSKTVSDVAGNSTTRSLSALIDLTKPEIQNLGPTPATPNGANGWYISAVSNGFSASDALSGLPAGFTNPFSKSSGTAEGSAVTISSGPVSDVANNTNPGFNSAAFKIDLSDPQLGITDNNVPTYNICGSARPSRPSFNPSDAISGLDLTKTSDSWTTPSTASGAGSYTYSAQAYDMAGRSASYGPKTYKVLYGDSSSGGSFSGVLQPINGGSTMNDFSDDNSRFKLGSTVPVKFKLMCGTTPVDNAVAKLNVKQADGNPDPGADEAISTAASTTGNLFRYDSMSQQYIFNLNTKSGYTNPNGTTQAFTSQGTYTLSVLLDDGTFRSINIQLVK
jgi:hypothetical protein